MSRVWIVVVAVLLSSCGGGNTSKGVFVSEDTIYNGRYSAGFVLLGAGEKSSVVRVFNPWQGAKDVIFDVFLSRDNEEAPENFSGEVLTLPLKKVICMSSSYISFIEATGNVEKIVGISGAGFITNGVINSGVEKGRIIDVGYDNGINYEMLASLNADVAFVYGVSGDNSAAIDKMKELGLKVMYIGDYLENNPLGKAEWIVLFGELFDSRELAEQIFIQIETEYNRVKEIASQEVEKPKIMFNSPWMDTWFLPSDNSYMIQLVSDAGGDYIAKGDTSNRSRPVSYEQAFIYLMDSDFWLCPTGSNSIAQLTTINPKVKDMAVVRQGGVYNNNLRATPKGGSDFWESGTLRPDMILKDMIKIFHPDKMTDHDFYYFYQLK